MKAVLIAFGVAFLVAALVYLALPDDMYVETAFNIIVLSFAGTGVTTFLVVKARAHRSTVSRKS